MDGPSEPFEPVSNNHRSRFKESGKRPLNPFPSTKECQRRNGYLPGTLVGQATR